VGNLIAFVSAILVVTGRYKAGASSSAGLILSSSLGVSIFKNAWFLCY
jgi:hypothetical protein